MCSGRSTSVCFDFPAGLYSYTGHAAKFRGLVVRHLSGAKKMHWHIDYLLAAPGVHVRSAALRRSRVRGQSPADGRRNQRRWLCSSDCRSGWAAIEAAGLSSQASSSASLVLILLLQCSAASWPWRASLR